ncbi:YJU2 Splicing factor YJU2 [Candida maltosa Xu316]
MSERKAINKWYPPDYDPSKLPKKTKKTNANQSIKIRMMAPYSMRCLQCDEYIGKRRSFNARKEVTNEKYLNIKIIRFYITCPSCNNTITFKTDPQNGDYTPEQGAVRNFEKKKDTSKQESEDDLLARLEKEEEENSKFKLLQKKRKNNPFWNEQSVGMENLGKRLEDQQKQQLLNDQLEKIQNKVDNNNQSNLEDLAREKLNSKQKT